MTISKKLVGTVTKKWANTNIIWESNPELVGMLYKLIVQTKKNKLSLESLRMILIRLKLGIQLRLLKRKNLVRSQDVTFLIMSL